MTASPGQDPTAARPLEPDAEQTDVVEGGRPPRFVLPRPLGVVLSTVVLVVAVTWSVWAVAHSSPPQVASPTPEQSRGSALPKLVFTPGGYRELSRSPGFGELGVVLRNFNDTTMVIDSVRLEPYGDAGEPVPAWVSVTMVWPKVSDHGFARGRRSWPQVPSSGLAVAGQVGGAILVVTVHPPCGDPDSAPKAHVVVRYHVMSDHFEQRLSDLPAGHRAWLGHLVDITCRR